MLRYEYVELQSLDIKCLIKATQTTCFSLVKDPETYKKFKQSYMQVKIRILLENVCKGRFHIHVPRESWGREASGEKSKSS